MDNKYISGPKNQTKPLTMTTIKYSKERIKSNLTMGIVFISIGILLIVLSEGMGEWNHISLETIGIAQIFVGIFMFLVYLFENKKQYLTFKNGEIVKNTLFPKKVKISDIKSVRSFAGDIKLITENGTFIIDAQIADPTSLLAFENELKSYNFPSN